MPVQLVVPVRGVWKPGGDGQLTHARTGLGGRARGVVGAVWGCRASWSMLLSVLELTNLSPNPNHLSFAPHNSFAGFSLTCEESLVRPFQIAKDGPFSSNSRRDMASK